MRTRLGLPDTIEACLFDLDGVLTPTALVHAAAWQELFDEFLSQHRPPGGSPGAGPDPYRPFDAGDDYEHYVDGRAREDGVRGFLTSRGLVVPEQTVRELSLRKDAMFLRRLERSGVQPYPGSVQYLHAAREAGLRRAVVSASTHCAQILRAAGIEDLVEERVDGVVARREGLRGKPAPDTFLAAARRLGVPPAHAAVFEDALAGVAAGHAGGFGCVVGVDRVGDAPELQAQGADIVVKDLADLLDTPAATGHPA
jgi:beta-phosphoglucomutase family hydrolase